MGPKKVIKVLITIAIIGALGYVAYLLYFNYTNEKKLDQSTPEQALNVLQKLESTSQATVQQERAVKADIVPAYVAVFLPEGNTTTRVSQVAFSNDTQGFKISYAYSNQNITEVKDDISTTALTKNGYKFIESLHNKSKPVWILSFENSDNLVKANILERGETSGDVTIAIMPK